MTIGELYDSEDCLKRYGRAATIMAMATNFGILVTGIATGFAIGFMKGDDN